VPSAHQLTVDGFDRGTAEKVPAALGAKGKITGGVWDPAIRQCARFLRRSGRHSMVAEKSA